MRLNELRLKQNVSEPMRGSGRVGPSPWIGYFGTWPMASLRVGPDSIVFRMWPIEYVFERSSIVFLQWRGTRGWRSLSIVHSNPEYSKSVIFRPADLAALETILAQYGYRVSADESPLAATEGVKYSDTVSIIGYGAGIAGLIAAIVAGVLAMKLGG